MLLSWPGVNVDHQDRHGKTALHYAAVKAETCFSTRLVRGLIIKGASPSIKDLNQNLPIDFLKDYHREEMKQQIQELLAFDDSDSARENMSFFKWINPLRKVHYGSVFQVRQERTFVEVVLFQILVISTFMFLKDKVFMVRNVV